jgi:pimeloyl-ACP methyl ester carboxylesterase
MSTNQNNSGFTPVYKGDLFYEIASSGHPLLFIHAGVADCSMWDNQVSFFSQFFQVIRYDTRGYGKSRTESTEFSNRQDILDLFKHLSIERACIIGISRGGQIAIDFTLEHPDRVIALIPVAAGVSGFEFHPADDEKARRASTNIREYIHKIVLANYTRQDGQATAQLLDHPAANRLSEIHVPTLILVGEYDETITLAMADKLESDIPGAFKMMFPEAAHMLPMEHPNKFNEVVHNFFKKVL